MIHVQDRGWEDLSSAIVVTAVEDWRYSKRMLRKLPAADKRTNEMNRLNHSCESFFRSGWFEALTGLDGKKFLTHLKEGAFS